MTEGECHAMLLKKMHGYRNGYNGADLKSVVSRERPVGSNPTPCAKVIRKCDDLFSVMWLTKDTRETVYSECLRRRVSLRIERFNTIKRNRSNAVVE